MIKQFPGIPHGTQTHKFIVGNQFPPLLPMYTFWPTFLFCLQKNCDSGFIIDYAKHFIEMKNEGFALIFKGSIVDFNLT